LIVKDERTITLCLACLLTIVVPCLSGRCLVSFISTYFLKVQVFKMSYSDDFTCFLLVKVT